MVNYLYDCYCILNKVYGERAFLKQAINSTFIEEKNRALTVKTCYGVVEKDVELSYYVKCLTDKAPKLVIRTILKISMYAIKYLEKKPYAIIKNAVELTKKLGKGGVSGFVNAFLRRFIDKKFEFPTNEIERLSVTHSYPTFMVGELIKDYGKDNAEKIMKSSSDGVCLSFYDVDGEKYLTEKGVSFDKTPFENVYIAKNFVRNADYDDGVYTYQALGSVAICDIVEPCDKLLDCCAAPGGKSIRLSYKCGAIESWDIHEHRVGLIEDYCRRMKRSNITPKNVDSKSFDNKFEQVFDAVLCDAPCSGSGVVNENPDIKLNREENSIFELNREQLAILKNVSKYVKKGGYLYYSTCSIFNRENIDIVNAFMSDISYFEICEIDSKLEHINVFGANLFLPHISGGNGFFVAKLKRVK